MHRKWPLAEEEEEEKYCCCLLPHTIPASVCPCPCLCRIYRSTGYLAAAVVAAAVGDGFSVYKEGETLGSARFGGSLSTVLDRSYSRQSCSIFAVANNNCDPRSSKKFLPQRQTVPCANNLCPCEQSASKRDLHNRCTSSAEAKENLQMKVVKMVKRC